MLLLVYICTLLCNINESFGSKYNIIKSLDFHIFELKSAPAKVASQYSSSCSEVVTHSNEIDGIHTIEVPNTQLRPFYVYCLSDPEDGPAWTIFLRRMNGKVSFKRAWNDYKYGFGNMEEDFFIGLKKLNALTNSRLHELWVQLVDTENVTTYAKYNSFGIGTEEQDFELNILGNYSGTAGDSLSYHAGLKFLTFDRDHDTNAGNCAEFNSGSWWMKNCFQSFLNGLSERTQTIWMSSKNDRNLKYAHMAIRPVQKA